MSVSKWNYESKRCDGKYCIGDCDFCTNPERFVVSDEQREDD